MTDISNADGSPPRPALPSLGARLKAGAPLNTLNAETLYAPGPAGYTDYPTMEMAAA
jgi:N-ethylmaleimide reductase